jgi:hypothetical protein
VVVEKCRPSTAASTNIPVNTSGDDDELALSDDDKDDCVDELTASEDDSDCCSELLAALLRELVAALLRELAAALLRELAALAELPVEAFPPPPHATSKKGVKMNKSRNLCIVCSVVITGG